VFLAVSFIGYRDAGPWDHGLRRIANESRNLAGIKLRQCARNERSEQDNPDGIAHGNPLLKRAYPLVHQAGGRVKGAVKHQV
jgi:hypothetical protein